MSRGERAKVYLHSGKNPIWAQAVGMRQRKSVSLICDQMNCCTQAFGTSVGCSRRWIFKVRIRCWSSSLDVAFVIGDCVVGSPLSHPSKLLLPPPPVLQHLTLRAAGEVDRQRRRRRTYVVDASSDQSRPPTTHTTLAGKQGDSMHSDDD